MSFQLSPEVDGNKVFMVRSSEIEGRLDPVFYHPEYITIEKAIKKSKWGYATVKSIAARIADGPFGSDLKVDEYQTVGNPLLRVSNIRTGEVEGKLVYISDEKQAQLKRSKVYPNDVLLTKAGAILGYSAVFPESLKEGNITSHLVTITCKSNIEPYFLSHFFRSHLGQSQIYRWGNKSTRPELNTGEVENILVPTPPIPIQRAIVEQLTVAYSAKKEKETEAERLLNSIDDYLLRELGIELPEQCNLLNDRIFTVNFNMLKGRFDPFFHKKEFKKIEENILNSPWEVMALEDIFHINRGGSPRPINDYFTSSDDGLNWIKIGDTKGVDKYITKTKQKIKPEGAKFSRKVKEGDFILSNSMSFGRPYIMAISGYIHDGWLVFRPKTDAICKNYIHSILGSTLIYQLFKKATIGGVVENLNIDLVRKIKIPLPPLHKQTEIADHITRIRNNAKQLKQEAKQGLEQAKQEVEAMILGEDSSDA